MEINEFIIEYLDENPKAIYLETVGEGKTRRYRARAILRGEKEMLKAVLKKYGNPEKLTDAYLDKRCESGALRLSDKELELLLTDFGTFLDPSPRIQCAQALLQLKAESSNRGRGNKKNFDYEKIYSDYISTVCNIIQ